MLTLAALSRAFGGLKVIERLDLTVEVGDVLGVIGPNGAGKSTLFNMIAGVLPPSSGCILFDGRDITSMKPWDRSRIGIGRTYQVPKPFTHMSVFENVLVAATHGGSATVTILGCRRCRIFPSHRLLGSCLSRTRPSAARSAGCVDSGLHVY